MTGGGQAAAAPSSGQARQGYPVCERRERFAVTASRGVHPATGALEATSEVQFRLAFARMRHGDEWFGSVAVRGNSTHRDHEIARSALATLVAS